MAFLIEHSHSLEQAAQKEAAEKFAVRAQNDEQMNSLVHLTWNWADEGRVMALDLKGKVKIKGELRLESGKVVIELKLPFLAKPFGGIIRRRIEENLKEIFV